MLESQRLKGLVCSVAILVGASTAHAQDIKIALITSTTGAFELYAKQAQAGLKLGLQYATQGTMKINGRPVTIILKDDQLKPDIARAMIEEALKDDKADIVVGGTSSATTLAMMPLAEESKKILVADIAGADSITGEKWNRYLVRTGRNVTQEGVASALAISEKGTSVATLAQDYAFGKEGVAAFKRTALEQGSEVVVEEYAPLAATDFTASAERIFAALKDRPGKKKLWVNWVGTNPVPKLFAMNPARYGIEMSTPGTLLSALSSFKDIPNLEGVMFYYHDLNKNKANDWLVAEHMKAYKTPPELGTAFAFNAAIAIVKAMTEAGGTDTEKMLTAFEGMTFEGATGTVTIRKEDHQAMHTVYQVKYTTVPSSDWAVPVLVRKLEADQIKVPILNKRN